MSWKDNVFLGILGIGLAFQWKEKLEDKSRMHTNCSFEIGITRAEFEAIVRQSAVGVKRLKDVSIDGALIFGTVKSQSGLNYWTFKLDFNDYGHVTGKYWIYSNNDDSDIPRVLANKIQARIYGR